MFYRFAAIGVGHEIQYLMQPTSSEIDEIDSDESDELDLSDNEDDCATATLISGCGMDDSVAGQGSNAWNSDEDENNDEEFEKDEDDVDDVEDGSDMSDDDSEDVRY